MIFVSEKSVVVEISFIWFVVVATATDFVVSISATPDGVVACCPGAVLNGIVGVVEETDDSVVDRSGGAVEGDSKYLVVGESEGLMVVE